MTPFDRVNCLTYTEDDLNSKKVLSMKPNVNICVNNTEMHFYIGKHNILKKVTDCIT